MALLSEPIVLSLKTTIHQSQTQTDEIDGYNADDEHSVRPKRAANRGGCHDSEESIVVPDSQLQGRHLVNTTTSDLSDPPEFLDDFDSMFETNQLSQQTNGTTPGQVLKQVQDLSPTVPLARQQSFRPGTSNDEMLLRSSDAANFSPPSGQPKQSKAQVLVPASAHGNSPMKTRTGMEVRHSRDSTPMPRMDPSNGQVTNFSSPQILSRDNHAPNSAAKRKQTILQPASGAKQHRADMSRLATRATAVTPLSVRFSGHDTTYDLPDDVPSSTRKAGSAIGSSAPAPGKNKRRTNTTTRKAQKADRYGERFNGPK